MVTLINTHHNLNKSFSILQSAFVEHSGYLQRLSEVHDLRCSVQEMVSDLLRATLQVTCLCPMNNVN